MSENNNDLNEVFEEELDDADVITVPIDDTLSNSGEAADAKAVGDALALKADKSEIQTTITVNGQSADNQGAIIVTANETKMSGSDSTTVKAKIEAVDGKTAESIYMSDDPQALTIAQAITGADKTADQIAMSATDPTTVKDAIDAANAELDDVEAAVVSITNRTGADIKYASTGNETIKAHVDALEAGMVKSVNDEEPDAAGNVRLEMVPFADNLYTEEATEVDGTFAIRTTGGDSSIADGSAWAQVFKGNRTHTGYTAEGLVMTVTPMPRTEGEAITATIDRDTWVSYVNASGTYAFAYTTAWTLDGSEVNMAAYGITVTNTPVAGDQISVVYVKEVRGTITMASPTQLVASGWNLYNHSTGYARVVKYSNLYGYKVGGTYTGLAFAETLSGTQTAITPDADGIFTVTKDGYVFVTGGNSTDTYILATWSDWAEGPEGGWEAYQESSVDVSEIVSSYLPYGLCKIVHGSASVTDEIDFIHKQAVSRILRMAYTAENLADAVASGLAYEYDENYIYLERETAEVAAITVDESYTVSEHGLEWFNGNGIPVYAEILYGANLKDKLKRDVVTISRQTLTGGQQAQVRANIGAAGAAEVPASGDVGIPVTGSTAPQAITAGQYVILKGHGTLADGGYTAAADIAQGETLTAVNLTTCADGIANDIQGRMMKDSVVVHSTAAGSHTFTVPDLARIFVIFTGPAANTYTWIGYVYSNSGGTVTATEIYKGDRIASVNTSVANKITFNFTGTYSVATSLRSVVINSDPIY